MKNSSIKNSFLLLLAALIWGIAFVPQKLGGNIIGNYAFNCLRSFLGGLILIPVIFLLDLKKSPEDKKVLDKKGLLIGGICCGIMLFFGSTLQQIGLNYGADAGKAGFITALYMIFVPIFGLFLGRKLTPLVFSSVIIAVIGMYLLCIDGDFSMGIGDIFVLMCAPFFALHILVIDHFVKKHDGVKLSCIQFFTCAVISLPLMLIFDHPAYSEIYTTLPSLFYTGFLSCGVAYTLQIVGQKNMNPTVASIILSLESVFAVIAGMLFLSEGMSIREISGCILMFMAIILTQLPQKANQKS